MIFDVKFAIAPQTLDVNLGELYDVSQEEAERIYQNGYTAGETEGYESGKADGYAEGESAGYTQGYEAGKTAIRDGTAIDPTKAYRCMYYNYSQTVEDTVEALSKLTYVQTPLLDYPIYAIYANTTDGNVGYFIIATKMSETIYEISMVHEISTAGYTGFFSSNPTYTVAFNGWVLSPSSVDVKAYFIPEGVYFSKNFDYCLTDFNGIPVGQENEKIKNVISATPF